MHAVILCPYAVHRIFVPEQRKVGMTKVHDDVQLTLDVIIAILSRTWV